MKYSFMSENLEVFRGQTKLFGPRNITIPMGKVVGIYGANGSGKTTLLKAIGGQLQSGITGRIVWFEQPELKGQPTLLHRRIGFQVQNAPTFGNLTVREQLTLAARNRSDSLRSIRLAVDTVLSDMPWLAERQNIRANRLNGGTRRLLSVGMSFVGMNFGLVICDEPTNDLSQSIATELSNVLRTVARRDNNSVIVVSHDYRFLKMTVDKDHFIALKTYDDVPKNPAVQPLPNQSLSQPVLLQQTTPSNETDCNIVPPQEPIPATKADMVQCSNETRKSRYKVRRTRPNKSCCAQKPGARTESKAAFYRATRSTESNKYVKQNIVDRAFADCSGQSSNESQQADFSFQFDDGWSFI